MGRPSKLTDKDWLAIERRVLAGEGVRALAKEFGISPGRISARFSEQTKHQKSVAKQLADAEVEFSKLPVSQQLSVRELADQLKAVSANLASAAYHSTATALKLSEMVHQQVQGADQVALMADGGKQLGEIANLTAVANQASRIGINLLAATKGRDPEPPPPPGDADGDGETAVERVAAINRRLDEIFSDAKTRWREAIDVAGHGGVAHGAVDDQLT